MAEAKRDGEKSQSVTDRSVAAEPESLATRIDSMMQSPAV